MESPKPEQENNNDDDIRKRRAIDELVRGRDLAYSLQLSLISHNQDILTQIMASFSQTLAILDPDQIISQSHFAAKSEDSTTSQLSCNPTNHLSHTSKERRGCYKRRKTSETWLKESTNLIDDGHAWRKYGQKIILHAHHPRNYLRCTHKFDQGCQATKQVQMIKENPPLYRTTYHGHHTCTNLHKAPQIILDNTCTTHSSILLSFDQSTNPFNNIHKERINHDNLIAVFPLAKHEVKEEFQSLFQNQTDYLFPNGDLMSSASLSAGGFDHGEAISSGVYSCTTSSTRNNWGMDHLVVGNDFDDVLQFDHLVVGNYFE